MNMSENVKIVDAIDPEPSAHGAQNKKDGFVIKAQTVYYLAEKGVNIEVISVDGDESQIHWRYTGKLPIRQAGQLVWCLLRHFQRRGLLRELANADHEPVSEVLDMLEMNLLNQ
jgi:hypothetical protein